MSSLNFCKQDTRILPSRQVKTYCFTNHLLKSLLNTMSIFLCFAFVSSITR